MDDSFQAGLTPAARTLLDEYLESERAEILSQAHRLSAAASEYPEIGVSDVVRAINTTQRLNVDNRRLVHKHPRYLRLLSAYITFGVFTFLLGGLIYILDEVHRNQGNAAQRAALLLAATGILLAFVGAAGATLFRLRDVVTPTLGGSADASVSEDTSRGEFLVEWSKLERVLRKLIADKMGDTAAIQGFSGLLERGRQADIIDDDDSMNILKLLTVRNEVAHGGATSLSPLELRASTEETMKLISKLLRKAT